MHSTYAGRQAKHDTHLTDPLLSGSTVIGCAVTQEYSIKLHIISHHLVVQDTDIKIIFILFYDFVLH